MTHTHASPLSRVERSPLITPQPGLAIAGRYAIERRLASGGMGSVWIARDRALQIDVAMKFMAPDLVGSAEARARFEREARAAAGLCSQHVVQILDYGVEGDTPYMAMELLQGESLAARIERMGRLSLAAAAPMVVQVGKALRTAHKAGLVHRDLKPGNVFLALKDEDEVAKVLDFGIAKLTGPAQMETAPGTILGSIQYMSPEQIRSAKTVDHRSDLWSLGVVVYRAITGRFPFPGAHGIEILDWLCDEHGPPPPPVAADLPGHLDAFFARALARDVEARFQSARELLEAFCAAACQPAPAPSSRPAPPRWKHTVPMNLAPALPLAAAEGGASHAADDPTRIMPKPAPALAPGRVSRGVHVPFLSTADVPTIAFARVSREAGTPPTLRVPRAKVAWPLRHEEVTAGTGERLPLHSLLPLWLVAGIVSGGLVYGVLRGVSPPHSAPAVASTTGVAEAPPARPPSH
jgi:eukaryotic-like serine/threonine-protein kinase